MASPLPAIVQSDGTMFLEVHNALFEEARDRFVRFADLVKSPEYMYTYRISPLSLWNAAACGLGAEDIIRDIEAFSRYPVPEPVKDMIRTCVGRYGVLQMCMEEGKLVLSAQDPVIFLEVVSSQEVARHLEGLCGQNAALVKPASRGLIKQALLKMGYPVEDLAGYVDGDPLSMKLRSVTRSGAPFCLRPYQMEASSAFYAGGRATGGSGVIVLPCGAGKTVVGLDVMAKLGTQTLILTTNVVALRQWIDEILDKTDLAEDEVGEYSGEEKRLAPVTVSTYQTITYRKRESGQYPHFSIFNQRNWGLIIYDEVHLLPAPVFRITADLQAKRRLGLTATLLREDGREGDVFSLIGPKKFDKPWRELEAENWIAQAECHEVRVNLDQEDRLRYALAPEKEKYRVAAINRRKLPVIRAIVENLRDERILVIGQYIEQLSEVAAALGAPFVSGDTQNSERQALYDAFRRGQVRVLVASKIANFSVDIPEASVAIQVSGTFGSRQEEAQRLGRILRPKPSGRPAQFFSIVSRNTKEQLLAQHRQLFLAEQGYRYSIWEENAFIHAAAAGFRAGISEASGFDGTGNRKESPGEGTWS